MNRILLLIFILSSINLKAQTQPRLVLPIGHTGMLNSAVFSPDDKLVLTNGDNTARIFDVATGKELQVLSGNTKNINSAVFSPDGKLALTSGDITARIWEVETGKTLQILKGHTRSVEFAVFSPDGKLALTASWDSTARIWETETGKTLQILKGHKGSLESAIFSSDGKLVLTASYYDSTARIYEVATGKELQVLSGYKGMLNSAVFSPDDKLVLTNGDKTARIWEVETGKTLQVLKGHTSYVCSSVFSPDGKLALTSSLDETSRLFEVATGKELQVLIGHTSGVISAVFSPDGKMAITTSWDSTARVFEVATGKELQVFSGHTSLVRSAVFSHDHLKVLTESNDGTARIWETKSGQQLQVLKGYSVKLGLVELNFGGKLLLAKSEDKKISLWELETGKKLNEVIGNKVDVRTATFSPNGKQVLTSHEDSTARIFEIETGKELLVLKTTGIIQSAEYSQKGEFILTSSSDGTARIWNSGTGKPIQSLSLRNNNFTHSSFIPNGNLILTVNHKDWTSSNLIFWEFDSGRIIDSFNINNLLGLSPPIFSSNGKFMITSGWGDTCAWLWDVEKRNKIRSYKIFPLNDTQFIASFSSNSKFLLISDIGSNEYNPRLLETDTGKEIQVFKGHSNIIQLVLFSADNKRILTTDWDNKTILWDAETGNKLQILEGHTGRVNSAVFSADGTKVITLGEDHKTIIWDCATGKALYTRIQLEGDNWLVYDQDYRFDGTPGAIDYLYLVCGMEVIDLAQVKDSLYVPGLASKIMNKVQLMRDGNRIPKLSDLNICDLTPLVEPEDEIKKGEYRFRITPRNGGLGATEVYVNGNLTFSFSKEELKQVKSKDQTIYYELSLTQAQLSPFLVSGDSLSFNPIVIKSKIEKGSIYSRGVNVELASTSTNELPRFFGVFIGVDEYGNPEKESGDGRYRNLDYAAKDANDLANAIEVTTGKLFNERTIYRLTGKEHPQPTKDEINATLDSIGKVALANDVLFIFFAGHGDIKKTAEGKSEMRFLTERATVDDKLGFSIADIMEWCKPQNIKAQKRVFVFDACHSGQAVKDFTDLAFSGRGEDEDTRILQLTKLKDKNGMMILAASAANESAYEDPTLQQGVLTYHMLNSIKNDVEKLSPSKDSLLNIRNWFDEVINQVDSYARRNKQAQSPISFGDGRFYIGKITPEIQQSIKVSPQKMRLGKSVFIGVEQAMTWCPDLDKRINAKVSSASGRGFYIYTDREGYYAKGTYRISKKKIIVSYILYRGEERINQGEPITLNSFKITDDPEKVADAVKVSIEAELGKLVIKK